MTMPPARGEHHVVPPTVVVTSLARAPRRMTQYARMAARALCADTACDTTHHDGAPIIRRLELRGVTAERRRLAGYRDVCGLPPQTTLPVTFPHVLAFPLQLALTAEWAFPLPATRLVQVENVILQHRPIPIRQELALAVRTGELTPHPQGRTVAIFTEVRADGELVWESESTMLHRDGPRPERPGPPAAPTVCPAAAAGDDLGVHQLWAVHRRQARRYAAVSGDRNPVHTHRLAARAAGLRAATAHGMWTQARALAAVQGELPGSVGVHAVFRRPIVLPGLVELRTRPAEGETELVVRDALTRLTHLRARAYTLSGGSRAGASFGLSSPS